MSLAHLKPFEKPAFRVTITEGSSGEARFNLRTFPSGASRNGSDHKIDPEGHISPLVLKCYVEYVDRKRRLKDNTLRASDNWQLGIPKDEYAKSLWRHFLDFCLHHRGFGNKARASLEVALCAMLFNIHGYLHELLKEQ